MKNYILWALSFLAVDCFAIARCERCGRALMVGSQHACSQKDIDKVNEKKRQGKIHSMVKKYRYDPDPAELRALSDPSPKYVISREIREWKNKKGKSILAAWWHISEDGELVYLLPKGKTNLIHIKTSFLQDADSKYVQVKIAKMKSQGLDWFLGVYMSKTEIRKIEFANMAKEKIKQYDQDIQKITALRVTDTNKDGAFVYVGEVDEDGRFKALFTESYFYFLGPTDRVADGTIVKAPRFYWAGVTDYKLTSSQYSGYVGWTKRESKKCANCIAGNIDLAIHHVRLSHSLFDKGDDEFVLSEGNERGSLPPPDSSATSLRSSGSGFFITNDGYLLTNHHVIEDARQIKILFNGTTLDAKIIAYDIDTDIALLKADGSFPSLKFSPSPTEKLGSEVFTIGFPKPSLQGKSAKVNRGVISGIEGFMGSANNYQIDVAVQPGNSGGPLCDSKGCVVGMIVAKLKGGENVNFAIKNSYVKAFLVGHNVGIVDGVKNVEGMPNRELSDVVSATMPSCVQVMNYR